MSFSETIFLFFLALVIFGPKKLPEIARQAGKLLNEFRRASNEFKSQIEQEISHLEVENKKHTILPPASAPEGTASRTLNPAPENAAPSENNTAEVTASHAIPSATDDEPLFASSANDASNATSPLAAAETPVPSASVSASVEPQTSQESHA